MSKHATMRAQTDITKTLGAFNGKDCGGPGHLGFFVASIPCVGITGLVGGGLFILWPWGHDLQKVNAWACG